MSQEDTGRISYQVCIRCIVFWSFQTYGLWHRVLRRKTTQIQPKRWVQFHRGRESAGGPSPQTGSDSYFLSSLELVSAIWIASTQLANKNTRLLVKLEFQINNKDFFSISTSQILHVPNGICDMLILRMTSLSET